MEEKKKKKKKGKKFEEGLLDLRGRTRESVLQRRKEQEYKDIFVTENVGDGTGGQVCHECGFTIDVEIF